MTNTAVVIGAGPAGLVSARELRRAGFDVVVLEQSDTVGGIWAYTPEVDDELTGRQIYSSLYDSLRTNLPRDLMAYSDYTFDSKGGGADDLPRYPHHTAVFDYLKRFATDFELLPLIRFGARVDEVCQDGEGNWIVTFTQSPTGHASQVSAATVVVCTGHYSIPRVPELPGIRNFRGRVTHSHNYRTPDKITGNRVALWGASASGADISMELARVGKEVYWCGDRFSDLPHGRKIETGAHVCASPTKVDEAGTLILASGATLEVDEFMYCTGYEYAFPFLDGGLVDVDDNRVYPLYRDILVPGSETLGFVGIPYLVVPFPLFEMQARWFCATLTGQVRLPSAATMREEIAQQLEAARQAGTPMRHYHKLGDAQPDYYNRLAAECGEPPLPDWFNQLVAEAQQTRMLDPAGFRDQPLSTRGPTVV